MDASMVVIDSVIGLVVGVCQVSTNEKSIIKYLDISRIVLYYGLLGSRSLADWKRVLFCGQLSQPFAHNFIMLALTMYTSHIYDHWVWDGISKPPEVELSRNSEAVYFYIDPVIQSTGTVGVRGTKAFVDGEHYWEIIFLEPPVGTSVMVGVGTSKALLRSNLYQYINLIGQDNESWGLSYKGKIWHNGISKEYCKPFFDITTKIGVLLNMYNGTLTFYKNGEILGEAFTGLNKSNEPLYPIVSSTATETELGLGVRTCRYLTLQEKCLSTIRSTLKNVDSVDYLPLPNIMKNHIREL